VGGALDGADDGGGELPLVLLLLDGEGVEIGFFPSERALSKASTSSFFSKNDLVLIPYNSSSFFSSIIRMVPISGRSEIEEEGEEDMCATVLVAAYLGSILHSGATNAWLRLMKWRLLMARLLIMTLCFNRDRMFMYYKLLSGGWMDGI